MIRFTYYGHACFMIETEGKKLLFDPFITPNEQAKHIDVSKIKPDYIFISHGHEDHIADTVKIATLSGAICVSNYEIVVWLSKQGVQNGHPMNVGGSWNFEFGKVKCVEAVHSSMLPDGSYGGNPMGFQVITTAGRHFYYSGDTALTPSMQWVSKRKTLDFAILPVGDNFTMGAEDALEAAALLNVNKVVGIHFDTFGFIKIDHQKAKEVFQRAGKSLILPAIGETIEL